MLLWCGARPEVLPAQNPDTASVIWGPNGLQVRFPIELAPVTIGLDTAVRDQFSGYEWRVVLQRGASSWLVAFVIPPDPVRLTLSRFATNEEAVRAGGSRVRRCDPDVVTIRCGRAARGLVRLVDGRLEMVVSESRWLQGADSGASAVHLAVRRGGVELWSASRPLPGRP